MYNTVVFLAVTYDNTIYVRNSNSIPMFYIYGVFHKWWYPKTLDGESFMENPSINGWELGVPPWIGNLHVGIPYSLDLSQVPSVAAAGRRRRPRAGGIWRDDRCSGSGGHSGARGECSLTMEKKWKFAGKDDWWMGHRWWVVSKKNIAFWRSKIGWSQTILPAVCCWENDYKSSTLRVPYFSDEGRGGYQYEASNWSFLIRGCDDRLSHSQLVDAFSQNRMRPKANQWRQAQHFATWRVIISSQRSNMTYNLIVDSHVSCGPPTSCIVANIPLCHYIIWQNRIISPLLSGSLT